MNSPGHARPRLWLLATTVAVLTVATPSTSRAQCPDGSAPPCATQPGRRAYPTIDSRVWVVVPFGNVTRAPDVDWLRDASVNLLTLEIGRWTDVRVVTDKRVTDLLRELPAATRSGALSLQDGLEIAKRAGAGMLVMGDFIKLGRGARITANVFDVRGGTRIRSVEHRLGDVDSILTAFGPLSRAALAVPPPPDARSGDIGTASLAAYRAYLAGVRAFNRFDMDAAGALLDSAVRLDSTFALAHFQLSWVTGWGENDFTDASATRRHALTAQRLGASLPPRERTLLQAHVHMTAADYNRACEVLAPLVARDSSDVHALFSLGDCAHHDNTIIPGAHDSIPGAPRWGMNLAIASMRRVLLLDPSFQIAYYHVLDAHNRRTFSGCAPRASRTEPCDPYSSVVFRAGDTLSVRPVSTRRNLSAFRAQEERSARERPLIAQQTIARGIAEQWVAADPRSSAAVYQLSRILVAQGDIAGASERMARVKTPAHSAFIAVLRFRVELAIKAGRGTEARAWFDSLDKAIPNPTPAANVRHGSADLAFGRSARLIRGFEGQTPRQSPEAAAYMRALPLILHGLPPANLAELERSFLASIPDTSCRAECRLGRLNLSFNLAPRVERTLVADSTVKDAFILSVVRRDSTLLRRNAFVLDSLARFNIAMRWADYGWSVLSAEIHLMLGDSTAALRALRFMTDTSMMITSGLESVTGNLQLVSLWARAMLQRADLAAAMKQNDEARKWYDRVLDLWADADAELQPHITRIRASRAALGNPAVP